jgi:hypothetical protein
MPESSGLELGTLQTSVLVFFDPFRQLLLVFFDCSVMLLQLALACMFVQSTMYKDCLSVYKIPSYGIHESSVYMINKFHHQKFYVEESAL